MATTPADLDALVGKKIHIRQYNGTTTGVLLKDDRGCWYMAECVIAFAPVPGRVEPFGPAELAGLQVEPADEILSYHRRVADVIGHQMVLRRPVAEIAARVLDVRDDQLAELRTRAFSDDLAYKGMFKRAEKAEEAAARVLALHTEFKIYEDCGHHDHEDGVEVVHLDEGGDTCKTTPLYSVCRHCCAPGDGLTYDHEESHDPVDCWPCPTRRAVEGS